MYHYCPQLHGEQLIASDRRTDVLAGIQECGMNQTSAQEEKSLFPDGHKATRGKCPFPKSGQQESQTVDISISWGPLLLQVTVGALWHPHPS